MDTTTHSSSSLLSTLFRSTAVNPAAGSKFMTSRNMGWGVVFCIWTSKRMSSCQRDHMTRMDSLVT